MIFSKQKNKLLTKKFNRYIEKTILILFFTLKPFNTFICGTPDSREILSVRLVYVSIITILTAQSYDQRTK